METASSQSGSNKDKLSSAGNNHTVKEKLCESTSGVNRNEETVQSSTIGAKPTTQNSSCVIS